MGHKYGGLNDSSKTEKKSVTIFAKSFQELDIRHKLTVYMGSQVDIGRFVNVIKYWLKVAQLDDTKYVKIAGDLAIKPNSTSQAKSVRHLLQSIGFNNGAGNVNLFIRILKERLNDNFVQNWNSEFIGYSRERTYILFLDFTLQTYLQPYNLITLEKSRISFSRLRMSSHRLKVETGRWPKPATIPFRILYGHVVEMMSCDWLFTVGYIISLFIVHVCNFVYVWTYLCNCIVNKLVMDINWINN